MPEKFTKDINLLELYITARMKKAKSTSEHLHKQAHTFPEDSTEYQLLHVAAGVTRDWGSLFVVDLEMVQKLKRLEKSIPEQFDKLLEQTLAELDTKAGPFDTGAHEEHPGD